MNFTPRAAEHTHSVRCAAKAMITAIENVRDSVQDAEVDQSVGFIIWLQDNPWHDARANLQDGVSECICPPCPHSCCESHAMSCAERPSTSVRTLVAA